VQAQTHHLQLTVDARAWRGSPFASNLLKVKSSMVWHKHSALSGFTYIFVNKGKFRHVPITVSSGQDASGSREPFTHISPHPPAQGPSVKSFVSLQGSLRA
jgi:hypothetical protein